MTDASFCATCGAPASGRFCAGCGTPLHPAGRPAAAVRRRWWLAGAAVAVMLAVLAAVVAQQARAGASAPPATAGAGAPPRAPLPDLSTMSRREAFDRLYDRAMRAAESGDEAEMRRFTPMALTAYELLDTVDADARYHAALLRMHSGGMDAAAALADSILADQPRHLFGHLLRGTAARWRRDEVALRTAQRAFLADWEVERAARRPEYEAHAATLDAAYREAQAAAAGERPPS
jgi:hypothetical protein